MKIRKMINNKLKRNLIIFMVMGLIFLVSCHFEDRQIIYPISQEEYLIGWMFHNIEDTDSTELSFSEEDLAKYSYVYNYPAEAPVTFDNAMFWVAPFQNFAGTFLVRLGVPQNRTYYLKGDWAVVDNPSSYKHNWSFTSNMYIDYPTSVYHQEHYKSEDAFYGINPVPGEKEIVYFGTAPFTPTSVVVKDNILKLNDEILRGYNGKSYLIRESKKILYRLYFDGVLIDEDSFWVLVDEDYVWDYTRLLYYLEKEGNYEVEIVIPSGYPIFREVLIKTKFTKRGKDTLKLPILKHIEFSPKFSSLEKLPISLEFENAEDIKKISMYYKFDNMKDWILLSESASSTLLIKSDDIKEINFKFVAETDDGNASYEIYPISLKRVYVICRHDLRQEIIKEIERKTTYLQGNCTDEKGNGIRGLRLEFYSDGKFLGATMTDENKEYYFEIEGLYDKVDVRFKGTGVYSQR